VACALRACNEKIEAASWNQLDGVNLVEVLTEMTDVLVIAAMGCDRRRPMVDREEVCFIAELLDAFEKARACPSRSGEEIRALEQVVIPSQAGFSCGLRFGLERASV
jgi:hypothetical protein